ncbi:MAG: hypothetical protein LH474_11030, partial [Chamaesiphon sp.]|nr:hypothetical protein [Chamaesiphon sp.]
LIRASILATCAVGAVGIYLFFSSHFDYIRIFAESQISRSPSIDLTLAKIEISIGRDRQKRQILLCICLKFKCELKINNDYGAKALPRSKLPIVLAVIFI